MHSESLDVLKRKLHYLCRRRATQELELLLMRFWEKNADDLTAQELLDLEQILTLDDMDLLAISLGQRPIPQGYNQTLFAKIVEGARSETLRTQPD
ncbi:antitoxin CptB [Desulfacinum hydrothermale DSM 13146]|uniref:FAD assembly factor SdhE n=1 Tax=Desulfacinum hydrothermale DSM 13146 TaxID=1121390 RepID=A0A1W1XH55_9BACT|nr:succinate dehydrogenase assembly factor 2 [Desulfacinum hydrothermale]SMC22841.1 antitoxin CptB [Desulfacinum hydrothermale DSM 13146]